MKFKTLTFFLFCCFSMGNYFDLNAYSADTAVDSSLALKKLFHKYRETPLEYSIKKIAPVLFEANLLLVADGEEKGDSKGAVFSFKANKDKNGQDWLYAYTDDKELERVMSFGDSVVKVKFSELLNIAKPYKNIGGIFINSGSEDFYLIPSTLFEELIKTKGKFSGAPVKKLTNDQIELFNKYYEEAGSLIQPYMLRSDAESKNAETAEAKRNIDMGIELYLKAIKINSECWSCYWMMAKGYQAIEQKDKSYEAFKMAYLMKPDNPDVANEYMMEAAEIGKLEEALNTAKEALRNILKNVALAANYALILLLNGQVDEALVAAKDALKLNPKDSVTASVVLLIEQVKSGKRVCPKSLGEI
jgi:tetratricopeptide (TPR) repeat protein